MTMANLQKLNPTQQELYNYLEQQTGQVNFEVLQPFTTQEMGAVLHISRNTVSQYLNEFFKEGWMVKINTRPVYYFLRETLSRKFNVQTLDAEYEDLQFLQQDLNHGRRADSCFAGVIGYHLSLKSAVEKCRVAVEYPPTGLPLVLAGEKGTGKRLLAGKTWEYAKEKQVVPAESRFAELDCAMWGAAEPGGTGFAASFKRRLEAGTGSDFLYLHGFDQLESSVQAETVRFLTAVLPELGAKYPRLIFGVQTVPPSLKNSVPVQAELLPLRSRSLLEKKRLIYRFLMQEEQRIGRRVQVTGQAYQMLMQYPYERNVGQLEQVIRTSCTNAYSRSRDGDICIGLPVLPDAVFESCLLLPEAGAQNRALTLDDLREDCGFEREHHLLEEIREQGRLYLQGSLECAGFCTRMVHRLEEYNNYILFQNKIADERIKGIEQGMLRISERIHELYGVGFPNSFILMLARWVYFGNVFDDALPEDNAEMQQLVADLTEAVRRDAPYSFAVASDLLLMVQNTTDVHFSSIGILMISAFVEVLHRPGNKLPVQAFIICHGYATASSIADVCNKMLHKYLFNAIDMPYDVPVSEIVSQVKKILYFNENRDVLILVDLGSLENITELLDDLPNVNLGIINNVSTAMALSVGSHILDGMPLAEVLENAKNASQTRYKILEKARKEDVILFVSESGSNVAAKVSELFMHSLNHLNTKVNARFLCYDVQTYEQLRQNGHWDTCNVLFAASTMELGPADFPVVAVEDIITQRGLDKIKSGLCSYLTEEEFEHFKQNLVNQFSLENVVESLTILNASRVLSLVADMLEEMQRALGSHFQPKTVVGLNLHISCLIERLVKKEEIKSYRDLERFCEEHRDFVALARRCFANIAEQYRINLPDSEIGYIYDYISHDYSDESPWKNEF